MIENILDKDNKCKYNKSNNSLLMRKYFMDLFCNKEDTMQCVLDILKSVMIGKPLRYVFFLTGSGCNGKSLLFKILTVIFKKTFDIISKDVILKKKS